MKISSAEHTRPHGLENAIQRIQANMDRRAARTQAGDGHVPGANALAMLQANLQRKLGEIQPQPTPAEPEPIAPIVEPIAPDAVLPAPAPAPGTIVGGLDLVA